MPILIRVETETGSPLDEAADSNEVILARVEKLDGGGLALAHFIDPWGNTVFNRLQIPALLHDLDLLALGAPEEDRSVINHIRRLARRTLEEPHLYLKFYGD